MTQKRKNGVPALRNADVTGMTEEKQEKIAEKTGRGSRGEAAKKFNEEQDEQAGGTSATSE